MLILTIKAEQPQRFHKLDHSVEKPYHLEKNLPSTILFQTFWQNFITKYQRAPPSSLGKKVQNGRQIQLLNVRV